MNWKTYLLFAIVAATIIGCSHNKNEDRIQVPPFPYEAYLDQAKEDQSFPKIGDDGEGFDAISHNIRYPELPAKLSLSNFADSLLLLYNTALAFNTMAYDVSTAERYINEKSICKAQADALDSINLSGIKNTAIKDALLAVCNKFASWIREGRKPNDLCCNCSCLWSEK